MSTVATLHNVSPLDVEWGVNQLSVPRQDWLPQPIRPIASPVKEKVCCEPKNVTIVTFGTSTVMEDDYMFRLSEVQLKPLDYAAQYLIVIVCLYSTNNDRAVADILDGKTVYAATPKTWSIYHNKRHVPSFVWVTFWGRGIFHIGLHPVGTKNRPLCAGESAALIAEDII